MHTKPVEILEVSPRDGLQNEKVQVSTADKLQLIERAIATGARRVEVTSFVNPKAVPQMADAEAVCSGLPQRADVTYIGLVMNARGAQRAIATGRIDQLGAVAAATDGFAMRNQGQTSDTSIIAAQDIIARAKDAGLSGQATIAVSFGCPFEGEVTQARVVHMAKEIAKAGPCEIALADTIGVGDPAHVAALVTQVKAAIGDIPIRVHFHNTRGTGLANVWAAIDAGASTIDASIGGIGGCPFVPGAAGNVATEDVQYMLERGGIDTGLSLSKLIQTNHWLAGVMDKPLPAMVGKAGGFPSFTQKTQVKRKGLAPNG